jgi:CRISPR-associated protein Csd1
MILQALKEYYDRKAAGGNDDIAPPGWERKEIPFLIVLDKDGNPVNIEDTREGEGKKNGPKRFWFLNRSNGLWGSPPIFSGTTQNTLWVWS